ncbi:hypothetical protein NUW54_g9493 [Trametes sanguinea]|uniref:Uncharacterized protein n=1 Tax=Trametes sanguinea TaxID=158606 RepID=A0ACC1P772_9APHY|nr:hypothetical protein NUW54_g9493 [Trametes sanguinea]
MWRGTDSTVAVAEDPEQQEQTPDNGRADWSGPCSLLFLHAQMEAWITYNLFFSFACPRAQYNGELGKPEHGSRSYVYLQAGLVQRHIEQRSYNQSSGLLRSTLASGTPQPHTPRDAYDIDDTERDIFCSAIMRYSKGRTVGLASERSRRDWPRHVINQQHEACNGQNTPFRSSRTSSPRNSARRQPSELRDSSSPLSNPSAPASASNFFNL